MRIGGWLFYSNLHIGIVAGGLLAATSILLGLSYSMPLLLLGISGSMLVYHLDHFWCTSEEDERNQAERYVWQREHSGYMRYSTIALVCCCVISSFYLSEKLLVLGVLLGIVGCLYSVRWLPGQVRPKDYGRIKPFLIASVWAAGSVLPVAFAAEVSMSWTVGIFVCYRLSYILPNLLVADWLDREGDLEAGIQTFAAKWSRTQLCLIVAMIGLGTLALGMWLAETHVIGPFIYVDMMGLLVLNGLVCSTRAHQWQWYRGALDLAVAWPLVLALQPFIV